MFACPCCGYLTFHEAPPGTYDVCPVYAWVDDPEQFENPSLESGCNKVSLNEARENYARFGAASREDLPSVRLPRATENPLYEQIRNTLPIGLPDEVLKEARSLGSAEPYLVGWTESSVNKLLSALDATDIAVTTGEVYHVKGDRIWNAAVVWWPKAIRRAGESSLVFAERSREQTRDFINSYQAPDQETALFVLWFKQER